MSSQTQQKINDLIMGKTLGRLGCGGALHYDENVRAEGWPQPVKLTIQIGDDEPIEVPISGFDLRREQGQLMTTQLVLVAREA